MRLSEDKISHLTSCIMDDFDNRDELDYIAEPNMVKREIFKTITEVLSIEDEIDNIVRKKLNSLSRKMVESTSEWDIMYTKYFDEEMNKKKL